MILTVADFVHPLASVTNAVQVVVTEGVTKYLSPSVAGKLIEKELEYLQGAIENPQRPLAAIIGGSKVSSKIGVIEKLLEKCDKLILGGGMVFTFYKARGLNVGKSLVEDDKLELAKSLEAKAKERGVTFLLPTDVVVADKFAADANTQIVDNNNIPVGWMGLDIAEKSIATFSDVIKNSKTILWNGPMGVFEMEKFQGGTKAIALAIAEATKHGAFSLIGGGDSVAAINKFNLADEVSYVSTGGGALLEYFEGKTLPGIAAIK